MKMNKNLWKLIGKISTELIKGFVKIFLHFLK